MQLSDAERELIEHIRRGEVGGLTIQRVDLGGDFVVCMAAPPFDTKAAIIGIGATFDAAWAARLQAGSLATPN